MLECYKNYTILALNYILNNSKEITSAPRIKRRCANNNIKQDQNTQNLKKAFVNKKE